LAIFGDDFEFSPQARVGYLLDERSSRADYSIIINRPKAPSPFPPCQVAGLCPLYYRGWRRR
jgi:hypothetical protein